MIRDKSISSRIFDICNLIVLIGVTILCLLPLWYCLMIALSSKAAIEAGNVSVYPIGFNLLSFEKILADKIFFGAFWVSVKRVVLGSIVTMVVLVLAAYPLSKTDKQFPARNYVMWIFIFCMLFNGGLIPWYQTVKSYGLVDNIWGLVLCGGVPVFNLTLLVNFIKNLPEELEEAAKIDGASPWRFLKDILIYLLKPVLATILLYTIVGHWNDFFQGMILSTKLVKYPLQTYVQQMVVTTDLKALSTMSVEQLAKASKLNNDSLNAAKIFVTMIPVLIVYPILQRYFVKGITLGSVKG